MAIFIQSLRHVKRVIWNYNFEGMKNTIFLTSGLLILLACQPKLEKETSNTASEPPVATNNEEKNPVDLIQLVDLKGQVVDLHDFIGKPIFLNFWATWCRPCIAEMPSIVRAEKLLAEDDYVFLLASDESTQKIIRFKNLQDFPLNFVRLESNFVNLGIASIPTTLIIGRDGQIAMNHVGALNWDSPEMIEKLKTVAQVDE